MSQNVAEAIQGRAQTLFEKMISNNDVANVVMALVGRLVIMAHQNGKPIEGISIDPATWSGRKLTARIEFHSLSIQTTGIWGTEPELRRYVASKAANLARVFDKNPGVLRFFNDMIRKLDAFCDHKRIKFADLKLERSIISPENILILSVSKDHLSVWER